MPPKSHTKADKARFQRLQELGCICCRLWAGRYRAIDVHHLLSGGVRAGHQDTIPLCPWHHRGVCPPGYGVRSAEHALGPSLAISKREFKAAFGTERELLEITNQRLEAA